MVKKKIKNKILIIGASSGMAKAFIDRNKDNSEITKIGRQHKITVDNFIEKKSKIKNDYNSIIFFIGNFIRDFDKFDAMNYRINFKILEKCIQKNHQNYKLNKRPIKFLIITSLDSIFPNSNSLSYSVFKAASSHLILNYQKFHKRININYFDIQPGAVKTKMRSKKKGNTIKPSEISKIIELVLSLDKDCCLFPIRVFPKKNSYSLY